ncbi:hypothetical protein GBA65_13745 [Rubrobacter marinus]|uniref:N-acetyltransferase domain-containing protein n=1 Tax=Rubrobacter marinus TaxID=2653852 RepID=A0A6G8PYU8_9ACTN|nr:hypothetical protein [Rubrobacter marinus]QIN79399.1 hypothetical protein GBA65_13745 [Rubrobacter marinus]
MHGWADFGVWRDRRDGLVREAAEEWLAREVRRGMGVEERGTPEVRWGTAADEPAVVELLDLNGMPRWVAFEERFIVAEGDGGRLLAAIRYRTESKRLILGLPVVDPWAGERRMIGILYEGAVELARGIGVGEVVALPTGPARDAQAGYLREAGWRRNFLSDAARAPVARELPRGGWRRLAALFGIAAVPFSRAFRG